MHHLAVIPARSGSKGLKDKNIRFLAGVPLIGHTIKAASISGIFDEIIVSTDSRDYADIAKKHGASVPFLRSTVSASDIASSWAAVQEVVEQLRYRGKTFDAITLLQPTSPLRDSEDIKAAYQIFVRKKARAVISVCPVDHSPLWCGTLPLDHSLDNFIAPHLQSVPRQMLPPYYRINGAIYMLDLIKIDLQNLNLYQVGCYAYVMSKRHSIDIDDELDFVLAETILSSNCIKIDSVEN